MSSSGVLSLSASARVAPRATPVRRARAPVRATQLARSRADTAAWGKKFMSVERGSRAVGVRSLVEAANAEPGASYDGDDHHEDTTYDAEDLTHPDVAMMKASRDVRKPFREFSLIEKVEYVFVRFTLISACIFVLLGVLASLLLSALLFSMGMKEVLFDAVQAWAGYSPVGLVSSAVGALDRFLLGMVCLVFGLGSFELFLARSNRAGQVRDRRLKKLAWLKVSSIDDLEQKVGEIIVAVMVVNLLEMSLHMNYNAPLDLVWAALAAVMSAGALALLHYAAGHGDHNHKDKGGHDSGAGLLH